MKSIENNFQEKNLELVKLHLIAGKRIRLIKRFKGRDSDVSVGTELEGILDNDVQFNKPIYLDGGTKNTSEIKDIKKADNQIFFITSTSVYELVPPPDEINKHISKNEDVLREEEEIEKKLKLAQSQAIDQEEMTALIQRRVQLDNQKRTDVTIAEINSIDKELEKHTIFVETITEFKMLMEKIGRNHYIVKSVIEHENAHANKADAIGAKHHGYSLIVYKNKFTDNFVYQPFASTTPNETWDKKEQIEGNIKIANAPKEYGNRLSPGDIEKIESLKKQLNELQN